jgi:hypothetical protein
MANSAMHPFPYFDEPRVGKHWPVKRESEGGQHSRRMIFGGDDPPASEETMREPAGYCSVRPSYSPPYSRLCCHKLFLVFAY